ncbi:hypothetical protein bsdtb5_38920 [Anaeromicropila herbilytica]|uniref:Uncharacterized protein n=1 Tax=Anaeromicropila herbilytica TaxID=2785025 RepID=A0A7R7EQC8_9FIRM|nr:hypothetical protein bsdtb5_38920 [Anaeromicropila herbilytica]
MIILLLLLEQYMLKKGMSQLAVFILLIIKTSKAYYVGFRGPFMPFSLLCFFLPEAEAIIPLKNKRFQ